MKKKLLSVFLAAAMLFTSLPLNMAYAAQGTQENLTPGAVGNLETDGARIEKSAERIPGTDEYIITLKVEGKNVTVSNAADIVLVLDRSGSMSGTFGDMQEAAKKFVDQLLTEGSGNRIAVVSYATYPSNDSNGFKGYQAAYWDWWYHEANEELKDAIDDLSATGGTNTQAGLHMASELLKTSTAKNKIIVLLSDGNPTYNCISKFDDIKVTCRNNCKNPQVSNAYVTGYDYSNYTTKKEGDGSDSTDHKDISVRCNRDTKHSIRVNFSSIDAAYYDATAAKDAGYTLYTIGYGDATSDAGFETIMKTIASKGENNLPLYTAGDSDTIDSVFEGIGNSIQESIKGAAVTDPMGEMVDLVYNGTLPEPTSDLTFANGGYNVTQGTVSFDKETNTFSWNPGVVREGTPAYLRYKVKLDVERPGFDPNKAYATNGKTVFTYTKADGTEKTLEFKVPQVVGDYGILFVGGYLVNKAGKPIDSEGHETTIAGAVKVYNSTAVENPKNNNNQWAFGTHTVDALEAPGYTLYGGTYTQNLVLSSENKSETAWFPYLQNEDTITIEHYFQQADGSYRIDNALTGHDTILFGETKYASAYKASKDGYSYDSTVEGSVTEVTYNQEPMAVKTLKLYYTRTPYTLTIQYQYADGTEAHADYSKTLYKGDGYSVDSPVIEGYTADKPVVAGEMPAGNVTVTVTYTINSYTLTVNYKYAGEDAPFDTVNEPHDYNDAYSIPSPEIPGYTADKAVVEGRMPAQNLTVDVIYTPIDYTLTIHYVYEDGSEAKPDHVESALHVNDPYSVTSPEIEGYTASETLVAGTMPAGNKEVTVVYSANEYKVTVHYVYEGGAKAGEDKTVTCDFGKEYSIPSYEIPGYTADKTVVEGTMPAQNLEFTVIYTAIDYTLTIEYVYAGGGTAAETHTETLHVGDAYNVESPAIPGYTADKPVVTGAMPAGNVNVQVVYTPVDYTLTVNYKYAGGGTASPSHIETGKHIGNGYNVVSPSIPGYTADKPVVTGTMPAGNVVVDVVYTAIDYTLTVKYQFADGTQAAEPFVQDGLHVGDAYSKDSPTLEGYTPTMTTVAGVMPAEDVTVVVVYNANPYTITVHYEYEDGTTAHGDVTEVHPYKGDYAIVSPVIEGYTADKKTVAGTMPAKNIEETVVYTRNNYKLTIHYEYEDGSKAFEDYFDTLKFQENYEVGSPALEGYTPSIQTVRGVMPAGDVEETVVYKANTYTLTINYYYQATGEKAAESVQQPVKFGEGYKVDSPVIENYAPDKVVVSGTMPAHDVTVDVYYTGDPYKLTVKYQYEGGAQAAATVQQNLAYHTDYSIESPAIHGYTPDLAVVEGTMPAEDVEVVVTYKANLHTLTVEYVYAEDGSKAAESYSAQHAFGTGYSIESPAIEGYTPSMTVVAGTMPDEDVKVVVQYTINTYNLTVKYEYEDGTPAAGSYFDTLDYNDPYNVESPAIEGYTPDRAVVTGTMPAGDKVETVIYRANPYKLTILYKYENGSEAAPSFTDTVKFKEDYSKVSPVIPGYTADFKVVEGTMPAHDVTVEVTYVGNPYQLTIEYVYENGDTAAAPYEATVKCGDAYSQESPVISGYTPSIALVEGTMPNKDVNVRVVYVGNPYKLTINYVYEDGSPVAESYEATIQCGGDYSKISPVVEGYTADALVVAGTMPDHDVTVDIVYRANPYKLTVHYVYKDGGATAAADHEQTLLYKDSYSVISPVIAGYTASQATVAGEMPAHNVEVTVEYEAIPYQLNIRYQYENGELAAPLHNETLFVGNGYEVSSPAIEGYTPDLTVVKGTMPASDVNVLVTYKANDYTLTIRYQYEDQTEAAATHQSTLHINDAYSVPSPNIAGFTPDFAVVNGVMPAGNVEKVVTYVRNDYNLTVNYVFENGQTAAPSHHDTLAFEEDYNVGSPAVEGYTPDRTAVSGKMPADDVIEEVVYKINSYNLLIHYVYENGDPAAEDYSETLDYHTAYSVHSPAIEGYTADKTVVAGTMPAGNVEVTVTYKANPYKLTVKYQYEDGTTASANHEETLFIGNGYAVESPAIEGYTPDTEVVEGTMPADDVNVIVTYKANEYTLTVKYQYEDGTEAADTVSEKVSFKELYNVVSPGIEGYTADKPVVSGSMPAHDVEVIVTYAANSYNLVIDYVYENGLTAADTHSESLKYKAGYDVASPVIEGYTADKPVVTGTMPAGDVYVKVTYTANDYTLTVKYQYEDGSEAAQTVSETVTFKDPYRVVSPILEGYTADRLVVSGTMPAADVEVIVTYTANSYNLVIEYVYENGLAAADTHSETLQYKAGYDVASPAIEGYTADKPVVTGTMPAGDVYVKVTYTANEYTLTVKYQYKDGSEAAGTVSQQVTFGTDYSVASPAIEGYTADLSLVAGKMPAHDVEVIVTYTANDYNLTVVYEYEDGTTAAPTHFDTVTFGQGYDVASPAIEGYTPDKAKVSGTMPAHDVEEKVVYTANDYTLTVKYQYEDGSEAAPDAQQTLHINDSYSVTSPSIEGYTADKRIVAGTMPASNVEVIVTYTANSYTLTVRYVYENGDEAAATHQETVTFGTDYTVASPAIEGYNPDIAAVTGTMPARDVEAVVTYAANDYTLTVKYQYEDGSEAAPDAQQTLHINDSYNVTSPVLEGYTADKPAVTGTMPASDVEVVVTYTANAYTLNIHYVYENGEEAAADYTETVVFGSDYAVESPAITGYSPDVALVEGTMPARDVEITVTYAANDYSYTVEYYYDGTLDAEKTETLRAAFGQTITEYTDKPVLGYVFEKVEGLDLVITEKEDENVIRVYYVADEEELPDPEPPYNPPEEEELPDPEPPYNPPQTGENSMAYVAVIGALLSLALVIELERQRRKAKDR